ncbi:MAG: response regulator [Myxococcota bacterium]
MNHTVLVVEDEDDLREMVRDALELSGYEVVTACDGREALAKMAAIENLCLVLLDLLMPVMNGWQLLEEIGRRPELRSVPIVVHSSAPSHVPPGVVRVLQKPVMFEQLIAVVQEYCAA